MSALARQKHHTNSRALASVWTCSSDCRSETVESDSPSFPRLSGPGSSQWIAQVRSPTARISALLPTPDGPYKTITCALPSRSSYRSE